MANTVELRVPDIGDFDQVDVIEVLIKPGDTVNVEQSLITLESDKATMEVPSSHAGTIKEVRVKPGDKVAKGDLIAILDADSAPQAEPYVPPQRAQAAPVESRPPSGRPAPAAPKAEPPKDADCDVVVIGAGPGGYTAAFRAADLGLKTVLIERYPTLGGVCLNVGCIPSKALLHAAKIIDEAAAFAEHGINFGKPAIDERKLWQWKEDVVKRLTGGLASMSKQRKIEVIQGTATFASSNQLAIELADGGTRSLSFRNCIIAAGSRVVAPPAFQMDHPRMMDSTDALKLEEIPKRLLVVGGGIIGLEMATVYEALGAKITVVELLDRLMAGADADMVRPLRKRIDARYEAIYLKTKVTEIKPSDKDVLVRFEGEGAPAEDRFDRVLVAVGRRPNSDRLNLEAAGVDIDERGFIRVDEYMRSSVPHIYAIGDIAGQPMLAHKASHEGKVAAENCAGEKHAFDARVIPSVAYTDPEVAWVGVTEEEAKRQGIDYDKASFPWAANGRSLSLDRDEGITKLLFKKSDGRIIGGAVTGPNAGDLISEIALAIEMGCEAEDIALTVHPHPTLSETVAMAAEAAAGTLTDLYLPKRR
jgi:dihydrolipoamide dehydrogenase